MTAVESFESSDFATHPEQRIRELRHDGIERVLRHLRAGHSAAAHEFMLQSVERQALLAGVRVQLPRVEL